MQHCIICYEVIERSKLQYILLETEKNSIDIHGLVCDKCIKKISDKLNSIQFESGIDQEHFTC